MPVRERAPGVKKSFILPAEGFGLGATRDKVFCDFRSADPAAAGCYGELEEMAAVLAPAAAPLATPSSRMSTGHRGGHAAKARCAVRDSLQTESFGPNYVQADQGPFRALPTSEWPALTADQAF